MSAASRSLRDLQQTFRDLGINDDVRIAGYVAFLLLIKEQWETLREMRNYDLISKLPELHQDLQRRYPDLQHVPEPPPVRQLREDALPRILWHLSEAYRLSPHNHSPAHFFQREVRFELLKNTKGGQYPTPHHLASWMASLAISGMFVDVIDLAAGSGGLLAAAHELINNPNRIDATGVDYDPAWSALGAANLLLHDPDPGATFVLGSSLSLRDSRENPYTAALLNPPFSGSRNQGEVWDAIRTDQYGTANANVLSVKSLQLLRNGGRAAILLPSGVLFGSGTNANLRAFFASHHLEAIITLDRECFQPFSHVAAHLLVLQKLDQPTPALRQPIWLCNVVRDGYPTGAGRDLTDEPKAEINELPRVRELVLQNRESASSPRVELHNSIALWATLFRPEDGVAGAAIRIESATETIAWKIHDLPSGALVQPCDSDGNTLGIFSLPYRKSASAEIIACPRKASTTQIWRNLLPSSSWSSDLPNRWNGGSDSVTVTIESDTTGQALKLQAGSGNSRLSLTFAEAGTKPVIACLLGSDFSRWSPWLTLQEETAIQDDKSAEKLQALALIDARDASQQRCGWLLQLNESSQNQSEQFEGRTAWLLITFAEDALFYGNEGQSDHAILIQSLSDETTAGWLYCQTDQPGTLQIELGKAIQLRREFPALGFAVGPTVNENAISSESTIFGILVAHAHLALAGQPPLSFEPRTYLPEPPPAAVAHPSAVIAAIRKNQSKLSLRVDGLLKMLGSFEAPDKDDKNPENLFSLASLLDATQQQILATIRRIVDEDGKPKSFTISELKAQWEKTSSKPSDDTFAKTLVLVVRLGILLEVHVQGRNAYRVVQKSDLSRDQEKAPDET